jgi:hypothetical protein
MVCDADEGSLDTCEAEALVLEIAALLVDACEALRVLRRRCCSVR